MSVTCETFHPEMLPSKEEASWNMCSMVVTDKTFQEERSPSKE